MAADGAITGAGGFGVLPGWEQGLLLAAWSAVPVALICRRAGIDMRWTLLVLVQVLVPMLGLLPVLAVLWRLAWPRIAARPTPPERRNAASRDYSGDTAP